MQKTVLLSASFLAFTFTPATAAGFLDGLSGMWSGAGKAYVKGIGRVGASCNMNASGGTGSVAMNGRCGVLLFKIPLGLKLREVGGGRIEGVYTGSRTGPAKLSGQVSGDKLTMTIRWGGPVNGDRDATMVLQRTGPNRFSQTVYDQVNGKRTRTSRFTFQRS